MNEYQLRSQMRDLEIQRIKARKARQNSCLHRKGGDLGAWTNYDAFCFLKLPTGEVVGTCLYCQKTISSIDPADKVLFDAALSKVREAIPESGQFLDHLSFEDKLFGQLSRYTPEEKDRILKAHIALYRKPKLETKTVTVDTHDDYLRSLPDDELKKIAKEQYAAYRKQYKG